MWTQRLNKLPCMWPYWPMASFWEVALQPHQSCLQVCSGPKSTHGNLAWSPCQLHQYPVPQLTKRVPPVIKNAICSQAWLGWDQLYHGDYLFFGPVPSTTSTQPSQLQDASLQLSSYNRFGNISWKCGRWETSTSITTKVHSAPLTTAKQYKQCMNYATSCHQKHKRQFLPNLLIRS